MIRRASMFAAVALVAVVALATSLSFAVNHEAGVASGAIVEPVPANSGSYAPGELIVSLADAGSNDGRTADDARAAIEALGFTASTIAQASPYSGTALLVKADGDASRGDGLAQAAQRLARVRDVSHVQPNYRLAARSTSASSVAADKDVAEQYYLNGPEDHGANVAEAWGKIDSTAKIDVAVLDTGVYMMQEYDADGRTPVANEDNYHQEFDSGNLDVADGADFVHSANNIAPEPLVNAKNPYGDDNGHGTHVSAIIAANARTAKTPGNDAVGMAGVSQNARIIPLKVLDSSGTGDTADFISAYSYLVQKKTGGALPNLRVINMSLSILSDDEPSSGSSADEGNVATDTDDIIVDGTAEYVTVTEGDGGTGSNSALQEQIIAAEKAGIATVCAAGNEGSSAPTYPSDYDECISVTALDEDGTDASYSNINRYKDISAPGTNIYSAWGSQADAYAKLSGTSQATAIVSGVASLLWAKYSEATVEDVKDALFETAHDLPDRTATMGLLAVSGSGSGSGLSTLEVTEVVNGSNGAVDAAAAVDYIADIKSHRKPGDNPAPGGGGGSGSGTGNDGSGGNAGTGGGQGGGAATPGGGARGTGGSTGDSDAGGFAPGGDNDPGSESASAIDDQSSENVPVTWQFGEHDDDWCNLAFATVQISETKFIYTGLEIAPRATVVIDGDEIEYGTDYQLVYSDNVNPGTAIVTARGVGDYFGTASTTFTIDLGTTRIAKLKAAKHAIAVKWSRQPSGKVGYQVRYSAKKNMKTAKTKTVAKNSRTKLKIKKLKRHKRYYMQVRTFKKIGTDKYFSPWSPKKAVKTR